MPVGLMFVSVVLEVMVFVEIGFFYLPVADFHTLIVETRWFCKTADDEVDLSLESLASEIKPSRWSVRVDLLVHFYQESVMGFQLVYLAQTAALKVTFERCLAYFYDFSLICVHTSTVKFVLRILCLILLDGIQGFDYV